VRREKPRIRRRVPYGGLGECRSDRSALLLSAATDVGVGAGAGAGVAREMPHLASRILQVLSSRRHGGAGHGLYSAPSCLFTEIMLIFPGQRNA
jgi:hypothetical protein